MTSQDMLDMDFAKTVDRLVTRILPNGTQAERLELEAEFAGLSQIIMLKTIQHQKFFDDGSGK